MLGSIEDFVSIVPFNKINKVVYTILSIKKNCVLDEFQKIILGAGLKYYNKFNTCITFYDNKNMDMDHNKINITGNFKNGIIDNIDAHFFSYISTENIEIAKKYFFMYENIENRISIIYGTPNTSVNELINNAVIPLKNSEIESIEYRRKLIYSYKYEIIWDKGDFYLSMKLTPEFQILICPNGLRK